MGEDWQWLLKPGNVIAVHFLRDDDGKLTASVEMVSGHTKHYADLEAELLKNDLEALAAGPPQAE